MSCSQPILQIFRRGFLFWLTLVAIPVNIYSQNRYSSCLLRNMVETMQISTFLDTLSDGIYQNSYTWNNRSLTIIVEDSEVVHVGYSLFPIEVQKQEVFPACRFIEQYVLWADLPLKKTFSLVQDMEINEIHFEYGSVNVIKSFVGDTNVSADVSMIEGKRYVVSWIRDNELLCSVSFPIDYCLLHNTSLHENEEKLAFDLSHLKDRLTDSVASCFLSPFDLIRIADTNIFVLQGDSIYFSGLNNTQYYFIEDSVFKPIFSSNLSRESFSNLVVSNRISNNYMATIQLIQYGHKSTTITAPFANLMYYFKKKGCVPFFGIMEHNDSMVTGLLLLANISEGYCHTIRLSIETEDIDAGEGMMSGRMVAYIPISRIKKLF